MTTALGPIAMAGSTAVPTQWAPASDRLWLTRWARWRCIGPPEPSDTTTNSSRRARRPAATRPRSWLTWPASRPLAPGAKLTATMVSARTGSRRVSTVACWTTGLCAQAAKQAAAPSTTSSTMGDRMVLLLQGEAGGRADRRGLAANGHAARRRRMIEALQDQAVGIGRRHAVGERRAQLAAGRLDQIGRDDDHQLGLRALVGIRFEQRAEHRDVAEPRELDDVLDRARLQQTGDGEALAARQLDGGRGPPGADRRDSDDGGRGQRHADRSCRRQLADL